MHLLEWQSSALVTIGVLGSGSLRTVPTEGDRRSAPAGPVGSPATANSLPCTITGPATTS